MKLERQNAMVVKNSLNLAQVIRTCPASGHRGKPVPGQTIKALLKVSLRSVSEVEYFFCAAQDCPVVYYSADGTQTFTVDQLREAVYQKEANNPAVLVCYCFQYTLGAFQSGSSEQRQALALDIKQGTADGQCACDIRNPQGSCCLANVNKLIKQLED